MARQNHGFLFEEYIIDKYHLTKEYNYTCAYDAYTSNGIPIQIKCIKKSSSIDMGDMLRNIKKNSCFILVIGFWKYVNSCKKIDTIYYHFIDIHIYKPLIGGFLENKVINALEEMKNISNDHKDDSLWKDFSKRYKRELDGSFLKPRFKRDHKSQKRIQCAIPNKLYFNVFSKHFKPYKCLKEIKY
jgi:hypothetical protein